MPLISIITPVYNSSSFIESCILNVISQRCSEIEHLIIDGDSTDGTIEIIKKFASQYSHIHWISEKDKGQSDAMNKGILNAQGDFISFLNVDDYYSEGTINEWLSILKKDSNLNFIVGNCNVWDDNNNLIYINKPKKLKVWHLLSNYYLPVNPSAYLYRKELHNYIGFYNLNNHFNMDVEFLLCTAKQFELKYFDRTWGNFRLIQGTKTKTEIENKLLESRKKKLFIEFLKSQNFKIIFLTNWVILNKKIFKIRRLGYKFLKTPFEMVYFKLKKMLFV